MFYFSSKLFCQHSHSYIQIKEKKEGLKYLLPKQPEGFQLDNIRIIFFFFFYLKVKIFSQGSDEKIA